jgi:hypothetical protein
MIVSMYEVIFANVVINNFCLFRTFEFQSSTHTPSDLEITGTTICADILDIVDTSLFDVKTMSVHESLEWINAVLADDSILSFPTYPGFYHNVHHIVLSNKLFVVALRDIEAGEELYIRHSKKYWAPLMGKNALRESVHSDLLSIGMKPTTLNLDGAKGVFATAPIKTNDFICEYSGPVVFSKEIDGHLLDKHLVIRFLNTQFL